VTPAAALAFDGREAGVGGVHAPPHEGLHTVRMGPGGDASSRGAVATRAAEPARSPPSGSHRGSSQGSPPAGPGQNGFPVGRPVRITAPDGLEPAALL
jgi:hypothetical protein